MKNRKKRLSPRDRPFFFFFLLVCVLTWHSAFDNPRTPSWWNAELIFSSTAQSHVNFLFFLKQNCWRGVGSGNRPVRLLPWITHPYSWPLDWGRGYSLWFCQQWWAREVTPAEWEKGGDVSDHLHSTASVLLSEEGLRCVSLFLQTRPAPFVSSSSLLQPPGSQGARGGPSSFNRSFSLPTN